MHQVYVLKRPHVEEFLRAMANIYECVLFTASLSKVTFPHFNFYAFLITFAGFIFLISVIEYIRDVAVSLHLSNTYFIDGSFHSDGI